MDELKTIYIFASASPSTLFTRLQLFDVFSWVKTGLMLLPFKYFTSGISWTKLLHRHAESSSKYNQRLLANGSFSEIVDDCLAE